MKCKSEKNYYRNLGCLVLVVLLMAGCIDDGSHAEPVVVDDDDYNPPEDSPTPPPEINPEKSQNAPGIFYSFCVKDNFIIYVGLPRTYDPESSDQYHTIYLLDGDWYFDGSHWRMPDNGVKGIVHTLSYQGLIPESIVVGIGYPEENHRERDFLYPKDVISEESGGGNNFYDFIKDELIPYIDAHYNTSLERTLIGHSYGGYFTMYAFFKYRHGDFLFTNFIAISPANYYHDNYLLLRETLMRDALKDDTSDGILPLKVYMAVGALEWDKMQKGFNDMVEWLERRNYSGFEFKYKRFYGLDHTSIVTPAIKSGLIWIFSDECTGET
jgi:predicted alpha/beta superfamily hydrolase